MNNPATYLLSSFHGASSGLSHDVGGSVVDILQYVSAEHGAVAEQAVSAALTPKLLGSVAANYEVIPGYGNHYKRVQITAHGTRTYYLTYVR